MGTVEIASGGQTRLGELIEQIKVSLMPSQIRGDTRFVGMEDIDSGNGMIIRSSSVSSVRSRVQNFVAGDVLYGKLRPYLRKATLVEFDGACSGELIVLRCSASILPQYLLMVLLSEGFTAFINSRTKGDRPRTSFATVSNYRIDLPSLEAQVDKIDRDYRLLATSDKLVKALGSLESAASSLMDQARTTLLWKGRSTVPFDELVKSIDYGTSQKSTYDPSGIPVLRIPNIGANGELDIQDLKFTPLSKKDQARYELHAGDLLLIRSNGSVRLVGRVARVREPHESFAFAGYLLRLRIRPNTNSNYLYHIISSAPFRRMVIKSAKSTTGINNLSARRLTEFLVPFASLEQQRLLASVLGKLEEEVSRVSSNIVEMIDFVGRIRSIARSAALGDQLHDVLRVDSVLKNNSEDYHGQATSFHQETLMSNEIGGILIRRMELSPAAGLRFSSLVADLNADYDALRDAVFLLLSDKSSGVTQSFDSLTETICLKAK